MTHGLEGRCSVQLSYWHVFGAKGFEPSALWSQTRCATGLRHAPCFELSQLTRVGAFVNIFSRTAAHHRFLNILSMFS